LGAGTWLIAKAGLDGRFRLDGVPAGPNQMLWVCDDAHGRVRLEDICVFPERVVEVGDVPLPDGCRVALRVVDDQGEPIDGARVSCTASWVVASHRAWSRGLGGDGPPLESVTDEAGRCVTPAWGKHWMAAVKIKAAGHRSVRLDLPLLLGPASIHDLGEVVLSSRPTAITGRVVDEGRQPIEQAIVSESDNAANSTLSAADGSFTLGCWNDRGSVVARKDGYSAVGTCTSRDEEGRDLVILRRAKWLRVRVTDTAGNPVTVSSAAMGRWEDMGDGLSKSWLDVRAWEECGDGRFRIEYLEPGRHSLTVRAAGYLSHREFVTVPADGSEPDEVTIHLMPGQPPQEAEPRPPVLHEPACVTIWRSVGWEIDVRRGCVTTGRWLPSSWAWCQASELEVDLGSRLRRNSWYSVQGLTGARRWLRPGAADAPLILLGSGAIQGRVADFDPTLAGYLWVVAFHDGPVFAETRVLGDGSFELRDVPAGEYGLRVGDGSAQSLASIPVDAIVSDPWAGAVRATVEPDGVVAGVELYCRHVARGVD
jgi:hypothetical protein